MPDGLARAEALVAGWNGCGAKTNASQRADIARRIAGLMAEVRAETMEDAAKVCDGLGPLSAWAAEAIRRRIKPERKQLPESEYRRIESETDEALGDLDLGND